MCRGQRISSHIYMYNYVLCTIGGYHQGARFPREHELPSPKKIIALYIHSQEVIWDVLDLHHFTNTLYNFSTANNQPAILFELHSAYY